MTEKEYLVKRAEELADLIRTFYERPPIDRLSELAELRTIDDALDLAGAPKADTRVGRIRKWAEAEHVASTYAPYPKYLEDQIENLRDELRKLQDKHGALADLVIAREWPHPDYQAEPKPCDICGQPLGGNHAMFTWDNDYGRWLVCTYKPFPPNHDDTIQVNAKKAEPQPHTGQGVLTFDELWEAWHGCKRDQDLPTFVSSIEAWKRIESALLRRVAEMAVSKHDEVILDEGSVPIQYSFREGWSMALFWLAKELRRRAGVAP